MRLFGLFLVVFIVVSFLGCSNKKPKPKNIFEQIEQKAKEAFKELKAE